MTALPGPLARTYRRARRRLAGLLRGPRVEFVYTWRYQIELPGSIYDPRRGERILAFLDATGLLGPDAVHPAQPAALRHLRRVHTDDYLDSLDRPGALTRIVGLAIAQRLADQILEAQRTMVGGTLAATRLALARSGIAVNLGGGLHHAFAGKGERFCAYNDVAVAIAELRSRGDRSRILIVDLDLHDGDGTRAVFARDSTVHTLSIHNLTSNDPGMEPAEAATVAELGHGVGDAAYLEAVRSALPPVFASFDPELVFYLAGTDPAADDQIGDWKITAQGLLERDLFVLECARGAQRRRKLPLVVVMAGGYGPNAWRYSARFFSALLNGGAPIEPPSTEEVTLMRYRRLAQSLEPHELTGDPRPEDDWGLSSEDLAGALGGPRRAPRFLGYYSLQGLELTLERAGLIDRVRRMGFERPTLELDVENPTGDTIRLFGREGRRELLIEVRARVDRAAVPGTALLRVEWMLLQNPRAEFTAERPRLPGQTHPGLGILEDVMALFVLACDRLQLDGVLFVPAYFHTAAQGRKALRFLDPEHEGLFRALREPLESLRLADATRAVAEGRVIDAAAGQPFAWPPMPMVLPVTDALRGRVQGAEYEEKVARAAERYCFELRA
jgi:acetoin utilization deacetylase AcuC-like enzyme